MEEAVIGALAVMMSAYAWFIHVHRRRAIEAYRIETIERSRVEVGMRGLDWLPRLMWEAKKMRSGMKTAALGIILNAIMLAVAAPIWLGGIEGAIHPLYLAGPCGVLAVNLFQFFRTGSMSMMDWFLTAEDRLMFGAHPP